MYMKLIGGILVIGASTLAGRVIASAYSNRPKDIISLQGALQILETEIIYGATPMPEAIYLVAQRVDGIIGKLFNNVSRLIENDTTLTVREAWEKGIGELWEETALNINDIEIIINLGKNLGISDGLDQKKHLDLAGELLKQQLIKAQDLAEKNVRMWNYLGFASGLVMVLITI